MQASFKEPAEQDSKFSIADRDQDVTVVQSAQHKNEIQNSTLTFTQYFNLRVHTPPPENTDTINFHLHDVRGKFLRWDVEYSLGCVDCDNTNDAILAGVDVGDHGCGPMEWCRVVFLREDEGTRLEVRGCFQPSMTLL